MILKPIISDIEEVKLLKKPKYDYLLINNKYYVPTQILYNLTNYFHDIQEFNCENQIIEKFLLYITYNLSLSDITEEQLFTIINFSIKIKLDNRIYDQILNQKWVSKLSIENCKLLYYQLSDKQKQKLIAKSFFNKEVFKLMSEEELIFFAQNLYLINQYQDYRIDIYSKLNTEQKQNLKDFLIKNYEIIVCRYPLKKSIHSDNIELFNLLIKLNNGITYLSQLDEFDEHSSGGINLILVYDKIDFFKILFELEYYSDYEMEECFKYSITHNHHKILNYLLDNVSITDKYLEIIQNAANNYSYINKRMNMDYTTLKILLHHNIKLNFKKFYNNPFTNCEDPKLLNLLLKINISKKKKRKYESYFYFEFKSEDFKNNPELVKVIRRFNYKILLNLNLQSKFNNYDKYLNRVILQFL